MAIENNNKVRPMLKISKTEIQSYANEKKINHLEDPSNEHNCLLYTSPSPRDQRGSRMPSSA